ncbi:curlin repeat-containing protein [uncultured Marixanthomonas sp.]|uniref:curlin repeat-containing protein n=1 Tax=uncultured Marixanthomonas sp. TaxID=757245 RepID=UPI0030D91523|tara:strand:+ start:14198 stop:14719 length:522 start_codon:yes stop_codon:yes gene_type:complete
MKKLTSTFIIMLFVSAISFSQTYKNEKTESQKTGEEQMATPEIFKSLGIDNSVNPRNAALTDNSVFIRQVGEGNRAAISAATNASEINLTQNGFQNGVDLDYTANTVVADLRQNGNYNFIKDYVYDPTVDASLELTQDGDGSYFERFGTNEITKSLKFRQTGNSPDIIVRSFQ